MLNTQGSETWLSFIKKEKELLSPKMSTITRHKENMEAKEGWLQGADGFWALLPPSPADAFRAIPKQHSALAMK